MTEKRTYGVNKMQLHSFEKADLLTNDLAIRLTHILQEAIIQRGQAFLVVSGGKTPVDLFKVLAKTNISWDKVTVILADERCVPLEAESRNERLVKQFLLQDKAISAHFISLYCEKDQQLEKAIKKIALLPTFDAVILGIGEDGHTASLFPCADELNLGLDENAKAALYVNPKTAPHQRVSLSKKRLLDSRAIFFHIVGENKLSVLHQAMAEPDPMVMPVSAFLHNQHPNVQVMYAP